MSRPKRMILGLIPNCKCNLKCSYCYISQTPQDMPDDFDFRYDINYMAECLSPQRLGGKALVNLTGQGETMLQRGIVDLCKALLEEGHYIELVTNLTVSKVLEDILALSDDLLERLEFKISFHYYELKKKKMLDHFWENVEKVQKSACSFTLELMPHDEIVDEVDEIIDMCIEHVGAKCQLTVGRADYLSSRGLLTKMTEEEYVDVWSKFESPMFDLKMDLLDKKRNEFCYAGEWTLFVNMYTGEASQCYAQPYKQNIFRNVDKPIEFCAVGRHCCEPFCINGHAHISLGVIPELETSSYAEIRNRVRNDGTEWFNKKTKVFFGTKLYDTNAKYSLCKQYYVDTIWYFKAFGAMLKYPDKVRRRLKLMLFKKKNDLNVIKEKNEQIK